MQMEVLTNTLRECRALKQYILQGYAANEKRLQQLGSALQLMRRTENDLDAKQVLSVVESYSTALDLLDEYDHQTMKRPGGKEAVYVLTYEKCRTLIESMRFSAESDLFGVEKDDSFKGSIEDTAVILDESATSRKSC